MFCRPVGERGGLLVTWLSLVVADNVPTLQEGYVRVSSTRSLTGYTPTPYDEAMIKLHVYYLLG